MEVRPPPCISWITLRITLPRSCADTPCRRDECVMMRALPHTHTQKEESPKLWSAASWLQTSSPGLQTSTFCNSKDWTFYTCLRLHSVPQHFVSAQSSICCEGFMGTFFDWSLAEFRNIMGRVVASGAISLARSIIFLDLAIPRLQPQAQHIVWLWLCAPGPRTFYCLFLLCCTIFGHKIQRTAGHRQDQINLSLFVP